MDGSAPAPAAAARLTLGSAAERASYACAPVWHRVLDDGAPLREAETVALEVAVLVADISGFTPLTTRLAQQGSGGAEELSRLLNDYFGQVLSLVAAHGGEPLKFAGDALVVQWPADPADPVLALRRAAACGLAVQARLFRYDAGGGTVLSMRVGIAAGAALGAHLRSGDTWHYVSGGEPFVAAERAQGQAREGETVVAAAAWAALAPLATGRTLADGSGLLEGLGDVPLVRTRLPRGNPEALERLAGHVQEPVRARLAAGHGKWLAELRRVSAVFVQATGLDPAIPGWPVPVQAALHRVHEQVRRYEGFLKEVVADARGIGFIVVFGVPPFSHEDDAARALRVGLDLVPALAALGVEAAVGVATGRCFCGVVGTDLRREYAVVGDAMNLAARLRDVAIHLPGSGRILCEPATRQACAGAVAFEALDPVRVKGREAPVAVSRPLHPVDRPLDAADALIGRATERHVLLEALERTARGGRPGAVLIEGEAGIGKSRLAAELLEAARAADVRVLAGGGDAVEARTPYFAWRPVFAGLVGLQGAEDPVQRRAALEAWLGPQDAARAPLFGVLFALAGGETEATAALVGQARAQATRELLLRCLERAAATRPLAVVLENAHWFDPSSSAFALDVARRVDRLLLAITTRPLAEGADEALAALRADPGCRVLSLGPLSQDQTIALACRRLGARELLGEVEALIRARAAGHPFFAEQLASSLRETGVVVVEGGVCRLAGDVDVQTLTFPDTVRGVVTSRIDRLPPREQLALKVASVIGPSFLVDLLRAIHPVHGDLPALDQLLEQLRLSALTVLAAPDPELAYAFNHVITHEVAYDLMLFAQRRMLHQATAEWYERAWREDRPELLGVLAHHWSRAGVVSKAVTYLEKSALRSFSMGLTAAAVDQSLQAVRLLGVTFPRRREDMPALIGAELARVQTLLAGRAPESLLGLPPLAQPEVEAVIGVMLRMLPSVHVSGQAELFALIALRCMTLTLEHGNGAAAPLAYAMHSIVYRGITQDTPIAVAFSRLSLELDARQGRHLFAPVAFIHHYFNQHWLGPIDACIDMAGEAADAGFAADDLMYACFNSSAQVIYLAYAGRPLAEVMEAARRSYARNGRRLLNAAWHCVLELQIAKALAGLTGDVATLTDAEYDEARDLASVCDSDMHEEAGWYLGSKVRLHYLAGDAAGALAWVPRALGMLHAVGGQYIESELAVFRALALLARAGGADPADGEARGCLEQAREVVQTIRRWHAVGERSFAHRLALVEGELARVEGRPEEARAHLLAAADHALAVGQIQYEGLAHERRAALLAALGDPGAREAVEAAREAWSLWGADGLVQRLDRLYGADSGALS